MFRLLTGFSILLIGLLPVFSFASLKSDIATLEEDFEIATTDMYTMIYVREITEQLQDRCSTEHMQLAKEYTTKITAILEAKYDIRSDAAVLAHSRNMYEKLAQVHFTVLDKLSEKNYCILKYLLYQVQQYLRDAHLLILEDTDIIKDFEGFDSSELYGWSIKRAYLDTLLEELETYKHKLGVDMSFSLKNSYFKDDLTASQLQLLTRSQKLMEATIYKVLYNLQQADLFDANDVEVLQDKIIFEYVEVCGMVNGKYEIKETLTSKGEHISFATEALHLRVNLCPNFFVIRDLPTIYEKIVTHELGHHFYYYHDYPGYEKFEDVCRTSVENQKASCSDTDFVSDYAGTLSVEDYAEHFMHWFLDILPAQSSTALQAKTKHFSTK